MLGKGADSKGAVSGKEGGPVDFRPRRDGVLANLEDSSRLGIAFLSPRKASVNISDRRRDGVGDRMSWAVSRGSFVARKSNEGRRVLSFSADEPDVSPNPDIVVVATLKASTAAKLSQHVRDSRRWRRRAGRQQSLSSEEVEKLRPGAGRRRRPRPTSQGQVRLVEGRV